MSPARFGTELVCLLAALRDWADREPDGAALWEAHAEAVDRMRQIIERRHSKAAQP